MHAEVDFGGGVRYLPLCPLTCPKSTCRKSNHAWHTRQTRFGFHFHPRNIAQSSSYCSRHVIYMVSCFNTIDLVIGDRSTTASIWLIGYEGYAELKCCTTVAPSSRANQCALPLCHFASYLRLLSITPPRLAMVELASTTCQTSSSSSFLLI